MTRRADPGRGRLRTDLPVRRIRGRFRITEGALVALERLLPGYRGPDGSHEGLGFLAGYEIGELTLYATAIAPRADHGPRHVRCSEVQIAEATAAARGLGLGLLAQVHSHPADATGHSLGDDRMVFMPYEGMLSIVVPEYARFGLRPLDSLGVHQFQDGRWVLCERVSVRTNFAVLPGAEDLR